MTFVIGEGVLPSNEGRGYVLRRLIRRALLHRRHLGMSRPLADGVDVVVNLMKGQYPELETRSSYIKDTIEAEAARFSRTLEQGMELFEGVVSRHPSTIPAPEAFKLHDTFGFPLELTQELAAERGLSVDVTGFQEAMAGQRLRSRSMSGQRWPEVSSLPSTEFLGYEQLHSEVAVVKLRSGGQEVEAVSEGEEVEVYLDRTPFYAESGGQIGDTGTITGPSGQIEVEDTQKPADRVHAHLGRVLVGTLSVGGSCRRRGQRGSAAPDRPPPHSHASAPQGPSRGAGGDRGPEGLLGGARPHNFRLSLRPGRDPGGVGADRASGSTIRSAPGFPTRSP